MAITLQVQLLSEGEDTLKREYLTHWTSKYKNKILNAWLTKTLGYKIKLAQDTKEQDEERGFKTLIAILSNCQLLLNDARHFSNAHLRMTCFTDIPHHLSRKHCQRYGKFGIAFKKSVLIKYGANPVLYLRSLNKTNAKKVYKFICDANTDKITVEPDVLESLKKFFGFVQDYEHETDTGYHEREWRILENNLKYCKGSKIPSGKCGSFLIPYEDEKQYYFQFSPDDVEFLICPNDRVKELANEVNNKYLIRSYECLVL